MIKSANARHISELLNAEQDVIYFIPKYQREYVWSKRNWELLFDDMLNNEKEHFLGSIICINTKDDALDIDKLELIDGQQRMTTLSILLSALYFHLKEKRKEDIDNEDLATDLVNLKYKVILKSDKKTLRVQPSISGHNSMDYKFIIGKELGILEHYEHSRNAGLRRLYKAFRYFLGRLQELDDNENEIFGLKETVDFLKKVNNSILVKIEVDNLSDAFTLFETLNNRGVPLSPIDLIKNSFLNELEKIDEGSIDDNFNKWLSLIQNLSDEYQIQERFLRHFYNSYKNEKGYEIKGISKALRSNLIDIYDNLIKRNAKDFFSKLYGSSEIYNQLIFPENENNSKAVKNSLKDLINIGGAPSYALLLFVFEKYNLEDIDKVNLIDFLVKYFVRRNITDTPPTRDLDNIFIEIVKKLYNNGPYDLNIIKEFLLDSSRIASDKLFEDKLNGNLYEENGGATRFILCKLEEENNKTKETFVDLWARDDKNKFIWTIEHIFPQGENIPPEWIEMIADGNKELAQELQSKYVHTLGNLTLTGYNSKLSNMSFEKKRDRVNKEGVSVGYKNGLFLNDTIKDLPEWTAEKIKERSADLIEQIVKYYKVEK
jgi:uncharacterized protein with ParB-like and HNH nuclease domain